LVQLKSAYPTMNIFAVFLWENKNGYKVLPQFIKKTI